MEDYTMKNAKVELSVYSKLQLCEDSLSKL